MSGKQAKRYRALEGRVAFLEEHMSYLSDRCAEVAYRAERTTRKREQEIRRRKNIWRTVFLPTALAAMIALFLFAVVLLVSAVGQSAAPEEPEPAAVVCRWIGCDPECAVK